MGRLVRVVLRVYVVMAASTGSQQTIALTAVGYILSLYGISYIYAPCCVRAGTHFVYQIALLFACTTTQHRWMDVMMKYVYSPRVLWPTIRVKVV